MNWLVIVILVFLVALTLAGYFLGFVRMLVGILAMALALVGTAILAPIVNTFINDNTTVRQDIAAGISDYMNSRVETRISDIEKTKEDIAINNMNLPEGLRELLLQNNNAETYSKLGVDNFVDYVSNYIAGAAIAAICYLVIFIILYVLLRIVFAAVDLMTKLPLLNSLNRIAGALLGMAQALVYIWVFFAVVMAGANTEWGMTLLGMIGDNKFLSILYEYNLLWIGITSLIAKL
ncbi:MAG: CvpA family protein [Lachnospiraceae bacterium]|nr:CvpA family protein [Lachnospiraceae bacterium]